MKSSVRWSLYALAALGTAVAMVMVGKQGDVDEANAIVAAAPRPVPGGVAPLRPRQPVRTEPLQTLPERRYSAPSADPFGDTAQSAAPAAAASAPPPVAVAIAPALPTLPYTYLGRWIEDGQTIAFLGTTDGHNLSAKAGMVLGGGYQVESIGDDAITFKYLPLGARQTLAYAASHSGGSPSNPGNDTNAPAPEDAN